MERSELVFNPLFLHEMQMGILPETQIMGTPVPPPDLTKITPCLQENSL